MIAGFFGDCHGNLKQMWAIALEWQTRTGIKLDWLFQVGDFGIWPGEASLDPPSIKHAQKHGYSLAAAVGDFPTLLAGEYRVPIPTYFIRGNHEDQRFLLDLQRKRKDHCLRHPIEVVPNLFYVPDGCIFELSGLRIAGWGGCWGKNTWEMGYWSDVRAAPNKHGYARRLNHMTRDVFERLIRESFDILVTHDTPTGSGIQGMPDPKDSNLDPESITEGPNGVGVSFIRELIETKQPLYQFNGHWHEFRQNQFGRTQAFVLDKVHPFETDNHCMEIVEL
jgi:hypothetical protein